MSKKYHVLTRVGTASAWATANPVLLAGEKGVESDTGKEKLGDGTTAWNSLGYQIGTAASHAAADFDAAGAASAAQSASAADASSKANAARDAAIAACISSMPDGTYKMGLGVNTDGTITIAGGRITAIQEAS